jgi:hypothetical protein
MEPSCDEDRLCADLSPEPWWAATVATQPIVYVTQALAPTDPRWVCRLPARAWTPTAGAWTP